MKPFIHLLRKVQPSGVDEHSPMTVPFITMCLLDLFITLSRNTEGETIILFRETILTRDSGMLHRFTSFIVAFLNGQKSTRQQIYA